MTPLFFPYTFISDIQKDKILNAFGSVFMYSALKTMEHPDPRVKILEPVSGDDARIISFLNEYRQYAMVGLERASSFMKGRDGIPLFDTEGVSAIRSDVTKGLSSGISQESRANDPFERLFRARTLLEIARDYDEKKQEIEHEMAAISLREKRLLDEIKGFDMAGDTDMDLGMSPSMTVPPDDSAETNMALRLSSWAELFVRAWPRKDLTGDGFFLTTSSEALSSMIERVPELVRVGGLDPSRVEIEELSALMKGLKMSDITEKTFESSVLGHESGPCLLDIYVAHDVSPGLFFLRLANGTTSDEKKMDGIRNTVIGFFS